ncbi:acid phosphatase [Tsuneonella sp. HG249]
MLVLAIGTEFGHQPGMNRFLAGILALSLTGCAAAYAAPEDATPTAAAQAPPSDRALFDMGPAYLGGPLPDGGLLVGPPPGEGSEALARDRAANAAALLLAGSTRFALAGRDADLGPGALPQALSCAAGATISDQATPAIAHLLRRATADFATSTSGVKAQHMRARPFTLSGRATCTPKAEAALRNNGSYPSGHAAIGYGDSLVLAAVFPARAAVLVRRGVEYGDSRRVCNVHWLSDVEAGRTIAAATFARLQADPGFREDLAKAQAEAKGPLPAPDAAACTMEAAALGGQA